jgi:uncharacterized membrane protein
MAYNIAALLGYLPICAVNLILSIIWLVTEPKENKFLRFHAMQSLLLIGGMIVAYVVLFVCAIVLVNISSALGVLIWLVELAVFAGYLILSVVGMIKANQGQMWKMPIVGDIAEKNA